MKKFILILGAITLSLSVSAYSWNRPTSTFGSYNSSYPYQRVTTNYNYPNTSYTQTYYQPPVNNYVNPYYAYRQNPYWYRTALPTDTSGNTLRTVGRNIVNRMMWGY